MTLYGTLAPSDQQTLRLAPLWRSLTRFSGHVGLGEHAVANTGV